MIIGKLQDLYSNNILILFKILFQKFLNSKPCSKPTNTVPVKVSNKMDKSSLHNVIRTSGVKINSPRQQSTSTTAASTSSETTFKSTLFSCLSDDNRHEETNKLEGKNVTNDENMNTGLQNSHNEKKNQQSDYDRGVMTKDKLKALEMKMKGGGGGGGRSTSDGIVSNPPSTSEKAARQDIRNLHNIDIKIKTSNTVVFDESKSIDNNNVYKYDNNINEYNDNVKFSNNNNNTDNYVLSQRNIDIKSNIDIDIKTTNNNNTNSDVLSQRNIDIKSTNDNDDTTSKGNSIQNDFKNDDNVNHIHLKSNVTDILLTKEDYDNDKEDNSELTKLMKISFNDSYNVIPSNIDINSIDAITHDNNSNTTTTTNNEINTAKTSKRKSGIGYANLRNIQCNENKITTNMQVDEETNRSGTRLHNEAITSHISTEMKINEDTGNNENRFVLVDNLEENFDQFLTFLNTIHQNTEPNYLNKAEPEPNYSNKAEPDR